MVCYIRLCYIVLCYIIHIASPQFRNHPTPNLPIKLSLVLSVYRLCPLSCHVITRPVSEEAPGIAYHISVSTACNWPFIPSSIGHSDTDCQSVRHVGVAPLA